MRRGSMASSACPSVCVSHSLLCASNGIQSRKNKRDGGNHTPPCSRSTSSPNSHGGNAPNSSKIAFSSRSPKRDLNVCHIEPSIKSRAASWSSTHSLRPR
ncbi:hypothetical protein BC940DRAFT_290791 [Gongronella butleri]|nr:hypothetical protein BC940DRAFT_290791 [Gongronella butleri]